MNINILTWNIHKTQSDLLRDIVLPEIAQENRIDIIALQEAHFSMTKELEKEFIEIKYGKRMQKGGVRILIRKNIFDSFCEFRGFGNKLFFVHLKKKNETTGFNIAAVHLYAKNGREDNRGQQIENRPIIDKIKELEKHIATNKTILIGDFNQNPYEGDLTDFTMIGGEPHKDTIRLFTGINNVFNVRRNEDYWYNPMWNFMGDFDHASKSNKVTGTYFYYSKYRSQQWHLLDGIILRPSLMDCINYEESSIVVKTKSTEFLKKNINNENESLINEILSDHLPVKFSLSIN